MLETLQSLPLWLFLCFALLLAALAWWQAPRIRAQLVGFSPQNNKENQTASTAKYWSWRLLYLFLLMVSGLVIESIIWQQSTVVNTKDAEGKSITQPLPASYAVKRRWWQVGVTPLPTLVTILAGKFMMGSEEVLEQPVHEVTIPQAFQMSQHEVTFEQYDYFIWQMHEAGLKNQSGEKPVDYEYPNDEGWGRDTRPVINVSWNDAQVYVNWLSQETSQQCRLPSEAEWEYASRAGSKTKYSWGDEIGKNKANCDGCGSPWDNKETAPVGSFRANPFGIQDMHGNVWEWVHDTWHDNYEDAPNNGKVWLGGDDSRVLRGGSWSDSPSLLRSARRRYSPPVDRFSFIGFRVVCSPTFPCFHIRQAEPITICPVQWKHINGAGASGLQCGSEQSYLPAYRIPRW